MVPISAQINFMENVTGNTTNSVNTKNLTLLNDNQVDEIETTNTNLFIFHIVNIKINISLSRVTDTTEIFIDNNNFCTSMSQLDEYNGKLVYVIYIMNSSIESNARVYRYR